MKVAAIIVSRNRPDLVEKAVSEIKTKTSLPVDIYVVECGTDGDKLSDHSTIWYKDSDFKGKCFGHNIGLDYAKRIADYDYYLMVMNDVYVHSDGDYLQEMIQVMEKDPSLGVLSPTEENSGYPDATPQNIGIRPVTTMDYLYLLIRKEVIDKFGFLNAKFKYCWGAIHEYSARLYNEGYYLAYYDHLTYHHLGGTTYGAKGTNTISRDLYQRNAKLFAADYFIKHYGDDWDERFWKQASLVKPEIKVNTFTRHRSYWEKESLIENE